MGWFPAISGCFFPCGHLMCDGTPSNDASEMVTCIWISQESCWSACLGLLDLGEDWDSELLGNPQVIIPSLLVKTLVLSSEPPGYLWKPPQGTFLCLMASVSPTIAWGKPVHPLRARSLHARKTAPSHDSTFGGCHAHEQLFVCSCVCSLLP